LSPADQRALDALDRTTAGEYLRDFERAAAAINLATPFEPLPPGLADRLEAGANAHFASKVVRIIERSAPSASTAPTSSAAPTASAASAASTASTSSRLGNLGWLAAAACLMLAVFGWMRSVPTPPVANTAPPPPVLQTPPEPPPAPPTPTQEREGLLAKDGVLKITLGATKDPAAAGVTGDVVWDPKSQMGFVHFVGLAANDPNVHQYQIWIFDGARDKRYPVDGGVFDVPAGAGDVVIPIRAALMVHKPAAFAVTVEKPGGVVVSARGHVVALGAAG
jgi:hypothetical protein